MTVGTKNSLFNVKKPPEESCLGRFQQPSVTEREEGEKSAKTRTKQKLTCSNDI